MDMLVIRGILLAISVLAPYQTVPLQRTWGKYVQKIMDVYQRFCRNLVTWLTSTRVHRLGTKTFHNLLRPLLVARCLWLSITSCPSHCHKRSLNSIFFEDGFEVPLGLLSSQLANSQSISFSLLQILTFWVLAFRSIGHMDFGSITVEPKIIMDNSLQQCCLDTEGGGADFWCSVCLLTFCGLRWPSRHTGNTIHLHS